MFANGWALAIGVAAIAIPVVIHWLTRPRPTRFPVSTLRFIRGAVQQRRSRYRLRNFLILLFRSLAIAMLAAAIARPLLHQQSVAVGSEETAAVTRIVLLDCSQSMAARDGGIVRFERARPLVSDLLKTQPALKCNLLLAGASPGAVFDAPTSNLGALRDSLANAAVRPERLRLQQAINQTAEIFAAADKGSRLEFFVVSDFQRSNWATVDFSVLPTECRIELRSMAAKEENANLAVLAFEPAGRIESGREAEVTVRIGNYSDTPRHVRVEVQLGNAVVPLEVHCPARAVTAAGGRIPLTAEGWHFGTARLVDVDDALPDDNQLAIGLQVHPPPRIAILSRDKPEQVGSASYYVENALTSTFAKSVRSDSNQTAPAALAASAGGSLVRVASAVVRLNAADPDVEMMRQSDVVVLVRPGRLSSDTVTVLTAMLQRGRSLLYVAGDQLDAANLQDLAQSLGSSVSLPVEFLPRTIGRSQAKRSLTDVDRRRPPFSIFGDELASAVKSLEFTDGLLTRPSSTGLKDDIRATLNDQSALLTVTSVGRGRMAVLNTDLERSNIARTPVLVPLLGELISQELTTTDSKGPAFFCGEPFTLPLPVGEERMTDLRFIGPDSSPLSETDRGTLTAIPAGIVWNMTGANQPGALQVQLDGKTVVAALATIPNEESDLRSLSESVFAGRLSGGRTLNYAMGSVAGEEQHDDVWVWLAVACVGCIVMELLTLKLFRT